MEQNDSTLEQSKERLFIALALPEPMKKAFDKQMKHIKEQLSFKRWVHPMDLHITLQFLGDVPKERIAAIDAALRECAASVNLSTLSVGISGLGVFGRPERPSVLWAGIETDMGALGGLQRTVVESMQTVGFEPEQRPYKPHLTLARNYAGAVPFEYASLEIGAGVTSERWYWEADAITLYKSNTRAKPSYEPIGVYSLGK
ncbi:RNA 2',3'-cyclic phosphodiesterase [Paenibacillus sp. CCS19]|uniref:RNA 2',3'-cyclic phosphodiesterase n=1 Tax=Paenibacillus sp. CCS19 TaxID=3158387 RepID=UPI00256CA9A4|nr:RNA 2',3'-cyclic phosphodiesterase [Paenibacillus cellulosilyticus]GMK42571.1 RNA 2',3'-cyclic phosphodiesterase [Paenibacillus cellulosilyticus]